MKNLKRSLLFVLAAVLVTLCFAACQKTEDEDVKAQSVSLTAASEVLEVNELTDLTVQILPVGATSLPVTWTVKKDGAATTDAEVSQGKFSASAHGSYTLIASAGGKDSGAVVIKVVGLQLSDTSVKLVHSGNNAYPKEKGITANFLLDGVTTAEITGASSSAESVAVYADGKIKAKGVGQATITINCLYQNQKQLSKEVVVTVCEEPDVQVLMTQTAVTVSNRYVQWNYEDTVMLNNKAPLSVEVIENTQVVAAPAITWSLVEGEGIAAVSAEGVVTGLLHGTALVKAVYEDEFGVGHEDYCQVTVDAAVRYGKHENYDREGLIVNVKQGTMVTFEEEITLEDDRETTFINLQKIPTILTSDFGGTAPFNKDTSGDVKIIYIFLTDAEDPDNYIMIGISPYQGDSNEAYATRVGVRAHTYTPDYKLEPSGWTDSGLYGFCNINVPSMYGKDTTCATWGLSGSYGFLANGFSFYGAYLQDSEGEATGNANTLGFALEGTKLYLHHGNAITEIWDLKEDVNAGSYLGSADDGWNGFSSGKVKISICGGLYNPNGTNSNGILSILDIAGRPVTEADVAKVLFENTL